MTKNQYLTGSVPGVLKIEDPNLFPVLLTLGGRPPPRRLLSSTATPPRKGPMSSSWTKVVLSEYEHWGPGSRYSPCPHRSALHLLPLFRDNSLFHKNPSVFVCFIKSCDDRNLLGSRCGCGYDRVKEWP